MRNMLRKWLSYGIDLLLVTPHTNKVLKEIAARLLAIFLFLLFGINWDRTLDALEVFK